MTRTRALTRAALRLLSDSARGAEFLFRRSDARGDIHPDDADRGIVPGQDPDCVLFLGERGMLSLGVRTHELALPAFFARHRATHTGRGVSWALATAPSSSIRELAETAVDPRTGVDRADVVVVLVGITDVLQVMSPTTWERHLRGLVEVLVSTLPQDGRVVIGAIPPLDNAGSLSRPARAAAGVQGRLFNERTVLVADDHDQVTVVGFPEELTRSVWRPESEEHRYRDTYSVWGRHLSLHASMSETAAGR